MSSTNTSAALAWATAIAWSICYPIGVVLRYLALSVLFVLRLLYRPVGFLLQPVVYLGRFALACLVAPFTLVAKFEVCIDCLTSLLIRADMTRRPFTSTWVRTVSKPDFLAFRE